MSFMRAVFEALGEDFEALRNGAPVVLEAERRPEATVGQAGPVSVRAELRTTSDGYRVAYAYNPGQGASSNGTNHLLTVADLDVGRLHRKADDPLCRPARKFWGLDGRAPESFEENPCRRCSEIRARLRVRASEIIEDEVSS